jgi:leucyl aminopeptidase
MKVRVTSADPARASADVLVVPVFQLGEDERRPARLTRLDKVLGGRIAAVLDTGDFKGRSGESVALYPEGAVAAPRVVLLGLGKEEKADADTLRKAAGGAIGATEARRGEEAAMIAPTTRRVRVPAAAQALAEGAVLAGYRFDTYKEKAKDDPPAVRQITFLYEKPKDARSARRPAADGVAIAEGQNLARQLSNEPGNELTPAQLARAAQGMARKAGLACRVFGPAELKKRAMGGILAVGGGSANTPRLVVLEHEGRKGQPTVCLVGKGITFDSGGISIKPALAMDEMKHDMSGAAAVIGAMQAVAALNLPLHVVGIAVAAENLPSATAYRPGDLVKTAAGKTVEVLNTDAEGRVVLADALHHAATAYSPAAIVDLATLTGACVIALGNWCSGLFGSDDALVERIRKAGEASGERAWPMPLWDEHREAIKSRAGDIKNTGGREAGSATAAAFLSHFVGEVPWAHLDIAGTAWTQKAGPYQPPGATGVGVRLLVELLKGWRKS